MPDAADAVRVHAAACEPQVDANKRQADRAERHEAQLDAPPGQPLAEQRARADPHREHREQQRDDVLVAAEDVLGEAGELREEDRAVVPEPRDAEHRQPDDAIALREVQVLPGFGERVPVDLQVGGDRGRQRYVSADEVAGDRHHHSGDACVDRPVGLDRHHQAAGDRADQDRDERSHLDHAVAADQLLGLQVLRQDRVLDRAEQRRVHAHQRERAHQQHEVVLPEARETHEHDHDLEQLDVADQPRLLELVGELARGRGEQHEWRDEHGAREVDERVGIEARHARPVKRREQDQRVLVDVVVARAQELRPEERPEAALLQQIELVGLSQSTPLVARRRPRAFARSMPSPATARYQILSPPSPRARARSR
jgi:hypothetical protein